MKIILTHGYFLSEDPKEQLIMRPYPPLGILYISAYLEQKNFPNDVYDSTFSTLEQLKEYLLKESPDLVGIYTNLPFFKTYKNYSWRTGSAQSQRKIFALWGRYNCIW